MKTTLIAATLAITSLSAVLPAQAEDWTKVPQIDVPYGDLNLANPAGAEIMLRRIRNAASKVCGGTPDNHYAQDVARYRKCVRIATSNAVAQLNAALVTALHAGRPIANPRLARDGSK